MTTAGSNHLANALRSGTRDLHQKAERTGVIREIIGGTVCRFRYALFLRNLLPAYQTLEMALETGRCNAIGYSVHRNSLYRAKKIRSDLTAIMGSNWQQSLPLLHEGERYSQRIAEATCGGDGALPLAAHAYVRYLGDLHGGQVFRRVLSRSLSFQPNELTWLDFSQVTDIGTAITDFRSALEQTASDDLEIERLIAEAKVAFQLNIEVSHAVQVATV